MTVNQPSEQPPLKITGTVRSADVDPLLRDRLRRWLVTVRVEMVLAGELPSGSDEVTMLVHSPSRDFVDADVVGRRYAITYLEPFVQPYTGQFDARRAD